jgi:hypothetical protein
MTHCTLTTSIWGQCNYEPYFTNKETKILEVKAPVQGHPATKRQNLTKILLLCLSFSSFALSSYLTEFNWQLLFWAKHCIRQLDLRMSKLKTLPGRRHMADQSGPGEEGRPGQDAVGGPERASWSPCSVSVTLSWACGIVPVNRSLSSTGTHYFVCFFCVFLGFLKLQCLSLSP